MHVMKCKRCGARGLGAISNGRQRQYLSQQQVAAWRGCVKGPARGHRSEGASWNKRVCLQLTRS